MMVNEGKAIVFNSEDDAVKAILGDQVVIELAAEGRRRKHAGRTALAGGA